LQGQQPAANQPERSTTCGRDGDHLTAQQDFCCPRAGTQLSVNKDFSPSASTFLSGLVAQMAQQQVMQGVDGHENVVSGS
jgi:hypothetical protein